MTQLITMSGKASALTKIDPRKLDDVSAGIWALMVLGQAAPDLTFRDVVEGQKHRMSGKISNFFSDVGDSIGDAANWTVDKAGDAWGGLWDTPILKTANDGVRKILNLQPIDRNMETVLASIGQRVKSGDPTTLIIIAGGFAALLGMILILKKK